MQIYFAAGPRSLKSLTAMVPAFWYPLLAFIGVYGGALLCFPLTRRMPGRWLLAAALYLAIDAEVLIGSMRIVHLNWLAKTVSVLLALATIKAFRLSRAEVGLKLPKRGSWGWISAALALAVIWSFTGVLGMYPRPFTLQSLSYQAFMPGIAEELAYRGVAYAMLLRGFEGVRSRMTPLAPVLITSFCFGLAHLESPIGLPPPGWLLLMVYFGALQVGTKSLFGAMLGILRWRSGSLLGPFLAHGAYNVAGTVALARVKTPRNL